MEDLKDHIESQLGDAVNSCEIANSELTVNARRAEILKVISFLHLPQEYRSFDFMSPWEGAKYVLPGDEKVEGS